MVVSGRGILVAATVRAYFLSLAALRRSRHLNPTSVVVSAVSDFDRRRISHCRVQQCRRKSKWELRMMGMIVMEVMLQGAK